MVSIRGKEQRVVDLARSRDVDCPWCRSAEHLACKPDADQVQGGETTAHLYCMDDVVDHPIDEDILFTLSPRQAKDLGIVAR